MRRGGVEAGRVGAGRDWGGGGAAVAADRVRGPAVGSALRRGTSLCPSLGSGLGKEGFFLEVHPPPPSNPR